MQDWEFVEHGKGAYSRLFSKGDRVRKVCIVGPRKPYAEAYVVQTVWGGLGFDSYKLDQMPFVQSMPKERLEQEVLMQKAVACACSERHGASVAPLVHRAEHLADADTKALGFTVYHLRQGPHEGYAPVEGGNNFYREVPRVDLYIVEMERVRETYVNRWQYKKAGASLDAATSRYARSVVLLLADLGFLHNDYHLGNFMVEADMVRNAATNVRCRAIDYGNARRLTAAESERYGRLATVHEKVRFLWELTPETMKKEIVQEKEKLKEGERGVRNLYKWFWQKDPSDGLDEVTVDEADVVSDPEELLRHLPRTACVDEYLKTSSRLCRTKAVVKV